LIKAGGRKASFGAAGGAAGGGAAFAGGTGSALKLSTDGKGEGRHDSTNFLALTFGTSNLFGGTQHQFFEFIFTSITAKLINRHFGNPFKEQYSIFRFVQQGSARCTFANIPGFGPSAKFPNFLKNIDAIGEKKLYNILKF